MSSSRFCLQLLVTSTAPGRLRRRRTGPSAATTERNSGKGSSSERNSERIIRKELGKDHRTVAFDWQRHKPPLQEGIRQGMKSRSSQTKLQLQLQLTG